MKPIRRKQNCSVTTDPITGQDRLLGWDQEEHILSDEGSIDSAKMTRVCFLDCGCEALPAGRCFQCGAISCEKCHGRCGVCQKPLCLQHSHFIEGESGPVRLCGDCADKHARKQLRSKIGRFLTSPFVKREARDD